MPIPTIPSVPAIAYASHLPPGGFGKGVSAAGGAGLGPITAPTAFWRMEDLTDSSGNSLTLTNNGGTGFVAGKINNCAYFTRTNSKYLSLADNTLLRAGTGVALSFCCWIYLPVIPDSGWRLWNISDATNNVCVINGSGGGASFNLNWSCYSSNTNIATAEITPGGSLATWHFIAVTFDPARGSNVRQGVSFDGSTLSFPTNIGNFDTATVQNIATSMAFGARAGGTLAGNADVKVDAAGWWQGHALTNAEVQSLYNGGTGKEFASGVWA